MARVPPPGKMPRRRRWLWRLLGACLMAAAVSCPATLAGAATSGPPAPTGLSATPAGTSQIGLSWTAPAADTAPSQYNIYEGTSSGGESVIGNSGTTSYAATGLTSGTTYYFYVTAVYQSCIDQPCVNYESSPSNEVSATTGSAVLGAPTGLTATPGDSQVSLSWTAPASTGVPVTGYMIYDGTSSGGESATASTSSTSYTVTGLTSGTKYYFYVIAVDHSCSTFMPCRDIDSSPSSEVSATTAPASQGRKSQTIHFGRLAAHLTGVRFTVVASASSGLQVRLRSDTPGVCSVSGLQVATINPGSCTITASQGGNTHYAPARDQQQSFGVKPAGGRRLHPQSITFARPASEAARQPVRLSASASSGLRVSFRSDTPRVCSVSGRRVTIIKPGTCTITATQSGNTHYRPATDQTRSFQAGHVLPGPQPGLVIVLKPIVLAAIVLAAAAGALLLRRHRLRTRRPPPPRVRAEPHPGSPGTVRLRVTGPGVRGAVRIEPHQSYVYSRLERAQP